MHPRLHLFSVQWISLTDGIGHFVSPPVLILMQIRLLEWDGFDDFDASWVLDSFVENFSFLVPWNPSTSRASSKCHRICLGSKKCRITRQLLFNATASRKRPHSCQLFWVEAQKPCRRAIASYTSSCALCKPFSCYCSCNASDVWILPKPNAGVYQSVAPSTMVRFEMENTNASSPLSF